MKPDISKKHAFLILLLMLSTFAFVDKAMAAVCFAHTGSIVNYQAWGHTSSYQRIAVPFQVSAPCEIETISVSAADTQGSPGNTAVSEIWSNSSGAPNALIAEGGTFTDIDAGASPATSTYSAGTVLLDGVTYWAVLDRSDAYDGSNYWRAGYSAKGSHTAMSRYDGSSWATESTNVPNITINGTFCGEDCPEPEEPGNQASSSVTSLEAQAQQNLFNAFIIFIAFMFLPMWLFRRK